MPGKQKKRFTFPQARSKTASPGFVYRWIRTLLICPSQKGLNEILLQEAPSNSEQIVSASFEIKILTKGKLCRQSFNACWKRLGALVRFWTYPIVELFQIDYRTRLPFLTSLIGPSTVMLCNFSRQLSRLPLHPILISITYISEEKTSFY